MTSAAPRRMHAKTRVFPKALQTAKAAKTADIRNHPGQLQRIMNPERNIRIETASMMRAKFRFMQV
jgi:hypothetical protein